MERTGSIIREKIGPSRNFRDLAKFFARWSRANPPSAVRINEDCVSRGTHSLIFSSSMIDPEIERPRVQPACSRSAADRATSPCRSSLDEIGPAILRFVESQANAKCRREKKKRGKDEIATRPRRRRADGGGGRGGRLATGACCNQ